MKFRGSRDEWRRFFVRRVSAMDAMHRLVRRVTGHGRRFGCFGCRLRRSFTASHAACEPFSGASELWGPVWGNRQSMNLRYAYGFRMVNASTLNFCVLVNFVGSWSSVKEVSGRVFSSIWGAGAPWERPSTDYLKLKLKRDQFKYPSISRTLVSCLDTQSLSSLIYTQHDAHKLTARA